MLHAIDNKATASQDTGQKSLKIMGILMDQAEFLINQDELVAFESIPELDSRNKPRHSLGTFSLEDQEIAVYCLSDELDLLDYIPDNRETCIVLRKGNRMIGLICNEIKELEYSMFNIQDIPECMSNDNSPISALCVYQLKDGISVIGKMLTADVIDAYIRLY